MALALEKKEAVNQTWLEIKDIEKELSKIAKKINEFGQQLQNKYKVIAAVFNESYTQEDFIKITDFTKDTLYYCLDPLREGIALFFISSKDGKKALPIQFVINPPTDDSGKPKIDISFNPLYGEENLSRTGIKYSDILIPIADIEEPIKSDITDFLINAFENPPPPDEEKSSDFDSMITQRLFELTQNNDFKKRRIIYSEN